MYLSIYESNETDMDKLTRKDRLPLLWKRDPVIAEEFGRGATRGVYAVNNACFSTEGPDGEEKVKMTWSKQFVAM